MPGPIRRIRLPTNLLLTVQDREPRQTMVCADRVIDKSVLPIAPCPKHHVGLRIRIDDSMRPAGRYDHLVTRPGRYGEAASWIIVGALLRIDDRAPFPYLE